MRAGVVTLILGELSRVFLGVFSVFFLPGESIGSKEGRDDQEQSFPVECFLIFFVGDRGGVVPFRLLLFL